MSRVRNHKILKYFVNRELITELWYKTPVYKALAAPVVLIKRRQIYSRLPFTSAGIAIMLALFGIVPPQLWRDWFVFALFWLLSVMFILKTPNIRAAANHSIYLYIFVLTALFLRIETSAAFMLLSLLAVIGISFLIMHVITEPPDVFKILCGIYIAVFARAVYVSIDTVFRVDLQSGQYFSEFLVMLFPFAAAFAFLKRNKRRRPLLVTGLLPAVYGVIAVIFDIGDIVQQQISAIPLDGDFLDYAMMAQGIYARAGTVGTQPFLDIFAAYISARESQHLGVQIFFYIGTAALLLFLWHVIRFVRKSIVGIFRKKGDVRLVLIAGISALLGAVIMIPFEASNINVRTLFIYWSVIGIVGSTIKNGISE